MKSGDKRFILEEIQKDSKFKFIGIMVEKDKLKKLVEKVNVFCITSAYQNITFPYISRLNKYISLYLFLIKSV